MITFFIAAIVAIFSFLALFFNAYNTMLIDDEPSMLNLMIGNDDWLRQDGLTVLFVIQILIMFVSIVGIIIYIKQKNDTLPNIKNQIVSSYVLGGLSVIATILSFATLEILNLAGSSYVDLGLGPILYSILHIIVIALLLVGIIGQLRQRDSNKPDATQHTVKESSSPISQTTTMSDEQKIDLIIKYKKLYDEGIITKEEFEDKKKILL